MNTYISVVGIHVFKFNIRNLLVSKTHYVIFAHSEHFLPDEIYTSGRIIVACVLNKKISALSRPKIAGRINPERTVTSRIAIVASLEMSYRLPAF